MPSIARRATEGYTAENWRNRMFYTYILRSLSHPEQRYIGSTADLKASLAIRRFFLLAKISGVKRSGRRMPRRRGASAPEAGQCCTALWQTYPAAVLSIENHIDSQKRVFE